MENPYAVAERTVVPAEDRIADVIKRIHAGMDKGTSSIAMNEIWTVLAVTGDPLVERTLAAMRVKTGASFFITALGQASLGVSNLTADMVWFRSWHGFGTDAKLVGADISISVNCGQLNRMYANNLRQLLHTLQGRK